MSSLDPVSINQVKGVINTINEVSKSSSEEGGRVFFAVKKEGDKTVLKTTRDSNESAPLTNTISIVRGVVAGVIEKGVGEEGRWKGLDSRIVVLKQLSSSLESLKQTEESLKRTKESLGGRERSFFHIFHRLINSDYKNLQDIESIQKSIKQELNKAEKSLEEIQNEKMKEFNEYNKEYNKITARLIHLQRSNLVDKTTMKKLVRLYDLYTLETTYSEFEKSNTKRRLEELKGQISKVEGQVKEQKKTQKILKESNSDVDIDQAEAEDELP